MPRSLDTGRRVIVIGGGTASGDVQRLIDALNGLVVESTDVFPLVTLREPFDESRFILPAYRDQRPKTPYGPPQKTRKGKVKRW